MLFLGSICNHINVISFQVFLTSIFSIIGSIFIAFITSKGFMHWQFNLTAYYSARWTGIFGLLFAVTCLIHLVYKGFENSANLNRYSLLSILNLSYPSNENNRLNELLKSSRISEVLKENNIKIGLRKKYFALLVRFHCILFIFIYFELIFNTNFINKFVNTI